uniref:Protein-tyrosine-phosphatase n=1 Tax=Plectus sambesii TaxID=2011161 RepID=A0A914ULA9_9BILA
MPSFKVNPQYAAISEVVPGLYISGVSALNQTEMLRHRITLVINATSEVPNLRSLGDVHRVKLWLEDTDQSHIYPHLETVPDQIEMVIRDGGRVLVHCVAGVSRSASLCLAYLTKYRCKSLRDAYHLLSSTRPMVRPNLGFWRQLIAYEQDLKCGRSSVRIIRDDAQPDRLLPDVYLKMAVSERPPSPDDMENQSPLKRECRERENSGPKPKFVPVLEPLVELAEAAG